MVIETIGLHTPRLAGEQRQRLLPYNAAVLGFQWNFMQF
jgi:hypothetical protein